jgi:hypothetical protein
MLLLGERGQLKRRHSMKQTFVKSTKLAINFSFLDPRMKNHAVAFLGPKRGIGNL